MTHLTGKRYALPASPGHAPHIFPPDETPCEGTLTCECATCAQERAQRLTPRTQPKQPWEIAA